MAYLLDQIAGAGIRRVVLSTGYLAEQFESAIGASYRGLEILYAHEEQPLGTGGAIRFAGGLADADQLLVMNGDSYCDADLRAYIEWHSAGGHDVSLLLAKVGDASRYGTVEINSDGRHHGVSGEAPGASRGQDQRGRVLAPPRDARSHSGRGLVHRTGCISRVAPASGR